MTESVVAVCECSSPNAFAAHEFIFSRGFRNRLSLLSRNFTQRSRFSTIGGCALPVHASRPFASKSVNALPVHGTVYRLHCLSMEEIGQQGGGVSNI